MNKILDTGRLDRITNGDKAFEKRLLSLFDRTVEKCLLDLEQANDVETLRRICHELKGAAANLGAERIAALCSSAGNAFSSPAANAKMITAIREEKKALHTFLLAARRDAV